MAEKLYEIYGIPENSFLEYMPPPDYVLIIESNELEEGQAFFNHKLCPHSIRLWGQASYWTQLEAALLLAGIDPNDDELYAVSKEKILEVDYGYRHYYNYKYNYEFSNARDYLFLFERSALAPKASPIEWIKYFNLTVRNADLKHAFEPAYCEEWQDFFKSVLGNNKSNLDEHLNARTENNYLRLIFQLAFSNIKDFDPKKPFEAAALIMANIDTTLSKDTIAGYIQKAYTLASKERD